VTISREGKGPGGMDPPQVSSLGFVLFFSSKFENAKNLQYEKLNGIPHQKKFRKLPLSIDWINSIYEEYSTYNHFIVFS